MPELNSDHPTILVERLGLVERITLNRPEKRNALSPQLQDELIEAVHVAERSNEVRVIIIRGAGPSFCSGYDISPNKDSNDPSYQQAPGSLEQHIALTLSYGQRWSQLWDCRIPIIAQVHGYCIAGGTDVALHCDMVVAAEDARFGFPPVRSLGGPPTHMWLYHAGPQWTKRLLLSGDTISGSQAAAIGLALEAVPAEKLDSHVLEMAQHMAEIGHDLLVHNKRIVNLGVELMGRSTMQVLAGIHDALAHEAPEAADYSRQIKEKGVAGAAAERDVRFN